MCLLSGAHSWIMCGICDSSCQFPVCLQSSFDIIILPVSIQTSLSWHTGVGEWCGVSCGSMQPIKAPLPRNYLPWWFSALFGDEALGSGRFWCPAAVPGKFGCFLGQGSPSQCSWQWALLGRWRCLGLRVLHLLTLLCQHLCARNSISVHLHVPGTCICVCSTQRGILNINT